jgi:hypothetical protein
MKMPNLAGLFAPPKDAVLSLEVQARMGEVQQEERTQLALLVRHFLDRFFNNEMVSQDGEAKARTIQIAYAIALPGLIFALYLFPPYHYPGGRPFWLQVSDRYFYVMYSFAAMGMITIFQWDLFFPDQLDAFVLSTLPIGRRILFQARIVATFRFLGIFLLGINALGILFYPAVADLPGLARHLAAHLLAVSFAGAFTVSALLALQGALLGVLGERIFRAISPFVQGFSIAVLLTVLLLFPALSQFTAKVFADGDAVARWFPPFWFLGIYETLLHGWTALPIFHELAWRGCAATGLAITMTVVTYPLAYRRKMRHVVEGSDARDTRNWCGLAVRWILHMLLRSPRRRGIYHFTGLTLLRKQRHRVYLAMYGGLGLALIAASAVLLIPGDRRLNLGLSGEGLRAAIPIVAFWTVAGLRAAFLSPAQGSVHWIFRVIQGRPGMEESAATRTWVLLWALVLTLGAVAVVQVVAPPPLRGAHEVIMQILVAVGLCVLLTDGFFLRFRSIPFTGVRPPSNFNLAIVLIQYFGLFPPFVLIMLSLESWLEASAVHVAIAVGIAAGAHVYMTRMHRRAIAYFVEFGAAEEDEEEFPQRLGLRY